MGKKITGWRTKGMSRDLSVSAFSSEFAFENKNLRLSTLENNTLMSWVNERGPAPITLENEDIEVYIEGIAIGTAIINQQLVLFTHCVKKSGEEYIEKPDHIYVLKWISKDEHKMHCEELYNGNLNFDTAFPIETLVSYEAEHIQKVYWTDNRNQPRLINIAATLKKRENWNDTYFDFLPSFTGGNIEVSKDTSGGGLFAPGVIQYCFTYFNKYGQQSNIVDISPLYYLSYGDRGASPEEKVSNSFHINIKNIDLNFDYIRLYSIQRTSLDLDPIIKILDDIPIVDDPHPIIEIETDVPLTVEYTTGAFPDKTLPVDTRLLTDKKVLNATATDGEFTVNVVKKDGTIEHNNESVFNFKTFIDDNDDDGVDIISLQDVINSTANGSLYQSAEFDYIFDTYYAIIVLSQDFDQEIQYRAESLDSRTGVTWDLIIDGVRQHVDWHTDVLAYNFSNEKWYILNSKDNIVSHTSKEVTREGTDISYIDTGTTGSTTDPYELLFVGGKEIACLTLADKDQTLFMGNCSQKNTLITELQECFDAIRNEQNDSEINKPFFYRDGNKKHIVQDSIDGIYSNTHTLKWNNREITTFKGGDTYRFGFQLQKKTGEWLEPIFMDDVRNYFYPKTIATRNTCSIDLTYAKASVDLSAFNGIDYSIYSKIRPVMVPPTIADREVLCQGVLNPTVFNAFDRIDKYPFAQPSWYFRPYTGRVESQSPVIETITGSVVFSDLGNDPDLSIEPSYFIGSTINAYILIVDLDKDNDYYLKFLEEGVLSITQYTFEKDINGYIQEDNWYDSTDYFWGAIVLQDPSPASSSKVRVALLGSSRYWKQYDTGVITNTDTSQYRQAFTYTNCTYVATSGGASFPIYNNMGFIHNTLLYYTNPTGEDTLGSYKFKFYARDYSSSPNRDQYYCVTFTDANTEVPVIINSLNGSTLRFEHYSHICSRTDCNTDYRKIEIQNAENLYDSVFSNYDKNKNSTNTEFFIDHSIVTLNSPDVEFDTNVQNYSKENLKLRVIGAIPITALVSAHSIKSSTSMLELGHNVKTDGVKSEDTRKFGVGELNVNIWHTNSISTTKYSSQRLVAEYLWNDAIVASEPEEDDKIRTLSFAHDFLIHPWHRSGSLNNDWRPIAEASSWLGTKKESNALYSMFTEYLQPSIVSTGNYSDNSSIVSFPNLSTNIHLRQNEEVMNYRLPKQKSTSSEINYYANIDKVLYNTKEYQIYPFVTGDAMKVNSPVYMKYKSNTHAIVAFNADSSGYIPILPYANRGNDNNVGLYTNDSEGLTFWNDTKMFFSQDSIASSILPSVNYDFLWIGELYKDVPKPYGGDTKSAVRACKWQIAGNAETLKDGKATIYWTEGDTYYQRYDCLKTYPFTLEDQNQIIEILSFMCETHVNIDGRYDKLRGQSDNTNVHPTIFNLINGVYSQQDNYFIAKQLDVEDVKNLEYPNQLTYSKTKTSGADVDLWTNVTLASTLELDGDKGKLNSLQRFNDQIIAFQDTGISQILYNENVQISSQQGVPIELANSGKVQGARYISDTVGCSNKWSITSAPTGIYFMDSIGKSIYLFNGQLNSLSASLGFNTWSKQNIPDAKVAWTPDAFENFVAYYDKLNQDILFINKETCLAFSDRLNVFTSFYSYENTPYFCNLDSVGVWIKSDGNGQTLLYKHNAGEYCNFFGVNKPYSLTLVGNIEPQVDKIFTNLEFRTCIDNDKTREENTMPGLPFDNLETWNEYQHGIAYFQADEGRYSNIHHSLNSGNNATLKRKFRIWRCDIPRDNAPISTDSSLPTMVSRMFTHPLDRMRNPWIYLKLQKEAAEEGTFHRRAEIHDIIMTYFS